MRDIFTLEKAPPIDGQPEILLAIEIAVKLFGLGGYFCVFYLSLPML
jgi:hypothetical protein